jgi:hypothetical protein
MTFQVERRDKGFIGDAIRRLNNYAIRNEKINKTWRMTNSMHFSRYHGCIRERNLRTGVFLEFV